MKRCGDEDGFMRPGGFGPFPQRYRFVFLDGCSSYSYQNFSMFGAVCDEVPPQDYTDSSNHWIIGCNSQSEELLFYAERGLRPAAFMGWTTDVRGYMAREGAEIAWTTTRGRTGVTGYWLIEALGNWHKQFLAAWMACPGSARKGLLDAKRQADCYAWTLPSMSPWPGVLPAPPPREQLYVGEGPQGPKYFSPVTSLKLAGYHELGFNEYNHADDPLPFIP